MSARTRIRQGHPRQLSLRAGVADGDERWWWYAWWGTLPAGCGLCVLALIADARPQGHGWLRALCCVMLERPCAVVHPSTLERSAVTLGLWALLAPFDFPHTLLPILCADLHLRDIDETMITID
jgi:hypothetical protein